MTAAAGRRARRRVHVQALAEVDRQRLEREVDLLRAGSTVARARDLLHRGSLTDRAILRQILAERTARR